MCRRAEEEVVPTVGLPRHRHFAGFFTLVLSFAVSSVQTSTRGLTFADPLLIILLYHCISGLRWYLYSRLEDDRVNSAD